MMKYTLEDTLSDQLFSLVPLLRGCLLRPCEDVMRGQITPLQFYVLFTLFEQGGSMPLSALIGNLGISKQQSTRLLQRLEELGAIRREADPSDRRRYQIVLLQEASASLALCRERICASLKEGISHLPSGDQQSLVEALSSLQRILPQLRIQTCPKEKNSLQ